MVATPAAPTTPTGFDLYDPDKDPKVAAANQATDKALTGLEADRAAKAAPSAPPVEKPTKPAKAEPKTHEHSPLDLLRARKLGFDADECSTLEPAELKELLQEAALAQLIDRPAPARVDHVSLNGHAEPEAKVQNALSPPPDPKTDLLAKLKATLDGDVADAIAAYVEGVLGALPGRVEKIEGQLGPVSQFVSSQVEREADNLIDQGFADLGEAYERFFGAGTAADLDRKSPEFKRRVKLVQSLKGTPAAKLRKAIVEAGRELFGDMVDDTEEEPETPAPPPKAAARSSPKKTRRIAPAGYTEVEAEEAALVTPNSRTPRAPSRGRDKAIATVREIQEKRGEDSDDDINQGEDKFL